MNTETKLTGRRDRVYRKPGLSKGRMVRMEYKEYYVSGGSHSGHENSGLSETISDVGSDAQVHKSQVTAEERVSLKIRFLRWLFPDINKRRSKRYSVPGLVAYYWTGGSPNSYSVGDVSATGLYLITRERWTPGTTIQMTLQKQDSSGKNVEGSICVLSEVVRWGEDGAGFNFVLSDYEDLANLQVLPGEARSRKELENFLEQIVRAA
jgi:hypothetical protein